MVHAYTIIYIRDFYQTFNYNYTNSKLTQNYLIYNSFLFI